MGSGIVLAWSYNRVPGVVASGTDAISSALVTTLLASHDGGSLAAERSLCVRRAGGRPHHTAANTS